MTVPTRVEGERPLNKPAKLKELILYISQEWPADPDYGTTRPAKTLFFADSLAYQVRGADHGHRIRPRASRPAPRSMREPTRNAQRFLEDRHLLAANDAGKRSVLPPKQTPECSITSTRKAAWRQ